MTFSLTAGGHHNTPYDPEKGTTSWEQNEKDLLAAVIAAIDANPDVVLSNFSFNGNNIQAPDLQSARTLIAEWESEKVAESV